MLLRSCAVALLVTACAGAGDESGSTTSPAPDNATTTTDRTVTPVVPSTSGESLPNYLDEGLIDEVRELASDEAGIPLEEFDVDIAAQVTWSDGSLGCPQPGQAYTQALVDGYWVVLSHGGETYDYRSTMEEDFRRCTDGQPPGSIYEDR